MKITPDTKNLDTRREVLKPFLNKRLRFEGVLIDVIEPSIKTNNQYGLVFASLYAKNEKIELDHAVIKIRPKKFKKANFEKYSRYTFTAGIDHYHKLEFILDIPTQRRHYMLTDINIYKMSIITTSDLEQPTAYVHTRASYIDYQEKQNKKHHPIEEHIKHLKNDGSIEKSINIHLEKYKKQKINEKNTTKNFYKNKPQQRRH